MGNSGEKPQKPPVPSEGRYGPNRDRTNGEEQREIGRNSLLRIAVVIVIIALAFAAIWLFH
jgi:hypothetical protein